MKAVYRVLLIVLIVTTVHRFVLFVDSLTREKPANVATIEYYRYYTIEYYNDEIDVIFVDPAYMDTLNKDALIIGCDSWDERSNEGHFCVLIGHDTISQFMDIIR